MKKTQWLVLLGDIRSSLVSFISIVMFVALGSGLFLGLKWNTASVSLTADSYYNEHLFHDFSAAFPYGITEEDVDAIRALDIVSDAEGGYTATGCSVLDGRQYVLALLSFTQRLDIAVVEEGVLPKAENEIGVERLFAEAAGLKVGDTLTMSSYSADRQLLNSEEFTITAIVQHPSYCSTTTEYTRGSCDIGDGTVNYYCVLSQAAFNAEAYDNCFSQVYIRCDGLRGLNCFEDEYKQISEELMQQLKTFGNERATLHCNAIIDRYDSGIAEAEAKIADGEQQLADAAQQISDGERQLANSRSQLAYAQKQYAQGLQDYNNAQVTLDNAQSTIVNALANAGLPTDIPTAKNELMDTLSLIGLANDKLTEIDTTLTYYADKIGSAPQDEIDAVIAEYEAKYNEYRDLIAQYHQYLGQYDIPVNLSITAAKAAVDAATAQLVQYKADIDASIDAINRYQSGRGALAAAQQTLQSAAAQISSAKAQIRRGEAKLDEAKLEYADGEQQLVDAKAQLEDVKLERSQLRLYDSWTIMDRSANPSANFTSGCVGVAERLCYSVATSFVFVGAMICYTAISRLIRESQVLIGVQKALGFTRTEVTLRYLAYSMLTLILGMLLGVLLAFYAVEPATDSAYMPLFEFSVYVKYLSVKDILIIGFIEFVCLLTAAWFACRKMLSRHAIDLMRGEKPGGGRTHFYEKTRLWQRLSLYTQTTVNNLANDAPRVIATLVSVVGCTALVVASMSMRLCIMQTPIQHFSENALYDDVVVGDNRVDGSHEALASVLDDSGVQYLSANKNSFIIEDADGEMSAATLIVPENTDDLYSFFSLKGVHGEQLAMPEKGVLLSYTYAKYFGTKVGDTIKLMDISGNQYECTVAGITQHYVTSFQLMMSADYYEQLIGESSEGNCFYILLGEADEAALESSLKQVSGFYSFTNDRTYWNGAFSTMLSSIEISTYLCLGLSFVMAMLVLLNLNVMFINEKKRELIVMRINGFGRADAKRYIYRDNIVLTSLGIFLGVAVGIGLGIIVLINLERKGDNTYLAPSLIACLIGTASSALFALITNIIALRRVDKLKMSDIGKV